MEGYIGFFDILGYRSLQAHNRDEQKQIDVLKEIHSVESNIPTHLREDFSTFFKQDATQSILQKMDWLVFSDTIVFTLGPIKASSDERILDLAASLMTARVLMYQMFEFGLPLRGALHFGEFIRVKSSMAGDGFITAYECAQAVQFAGCRISQALESQGEGLAKENPEFSTAWHKFICAYGAPEKDGTRGILPYLMWFHPLYASRGGAEREGLRSYVHNKFWEHGKQLGDTRAIEKLEETERFLRYCLKKQQNQ